MDRKWEISEKGRNSTKYGYYMLLIIAAPDVRDHLSDREVSTVLFPSSQYWEHGWRTSPDSRYLRTVDIHYHSRIQEVKSNVLFREAVQFLPLSATGAFCRFHIDIPNAKTPTLYKKWGFISQPWQSPVYRWFKCEQ